MGTAIGVGVSPAFGRRAIGGGGGPTPPAFASYAGVVAVNADGWTAQDGDAAVLAWGTSQANNYDPVGDPLTLAVRRPGYDALGNATHHVDTVTLMSRLRELYPNEGSWTALENSNAEARATLSDYVFSEDTLYSSSGVQGGLTNNSTLTYADIPPICALTTYDKQILTTAEIDIGLYVSHKMGRNGAPVAAVKFVFDDGVTTVEKLVLAPTAKLYASGLHASEYRSGAVDLSALSAGAITIDYIVYPWCGVAWQASVDGDAEAFGNTPYTFYLDTDDSYGVTHACIAASGTCADTSGLFATEAAMDTAVGPEGGLTDLTKVYPNIATALAQGKAFNNSTFGRNDCGGLVLHMEEGAEAKAYVNRWSGSNVSTQAYLTTIKGRAGTTQANVILELPEAHPDANNDNEANGLTPYKLCLKDMTLKRTAIAGGSGGGGINIDGDSAIGNVAEDHIIALDTVDFVLGAGAVSYNATIYTWHRRFAINCTCSAGDDPRLLEGFSTGPFGALAVGCGGRWNYDMSFVQIACRQPDVAAGIDQPPMTNTNTNRPGLFLVGHGFYGTGIDSGVLGVGQDHNRGVHLVATVFEKAVSGSTACALVHADGNASSSTPNVHVTHCSFIGQRLNFAYDDSDPANTIDRDHTIRNCLIQQSFNSKDDTFNNPTHGQSGLRDGNRPEQYGVGYRYNIHLDNAADGSTDWGVGNVWLGEVKPVGAAIDAAGTGDFELDAGSEGTGAGGGDYRPNATGASDVIALPALTCEIRHDFHGNALALDGGDFAGALQQAA